MESWRDRKTLILSRTDMMGLLTPQAGGCQRPGRNARSQDRRRRSHRHRQVCAGLPISRTVAVETPRGWKISKGKLIGISGSARRGSFNTGLLRAARRSPLGSVRVRFWPRVQRRNKGEGRGSRRNGFAKRLKIGRVRAAQARYGQGRAARPGAIQAGPRACPASRSR